MEKIKQFIESEAGKDIMVVLIVILVGTGSFALGRLSKSYNSSSGIKITYPPVNNTQPANVLSAKENNFPSNTQTQTKNQKVNSSLLKPTTANKNFFASNRGHKYYPIGCSAGKSIKLENRIYFATSSDAKKAGYELSSSCK